MEFPYVELKTRTLVVNENERVDATNKIVFNRALNKALSNKSFLVVGEDFNFRMRFLKSGTSIRPRWTSEKKIDNRNIKKYLSVGDPLTIKTLLDFYAQYRVEFFTRNIRAKAKGRPRTKGILNNP